MSQQLVPPIEHFRTQKTPKTDDTLRIVYDALIQAYDTVRQGRITDSKTLRLIAGQFEAIADNPEASHIFPYDAGRAAAVLYNCAVDIDMRARTRSHAQTSQTIHESVSQTTTTEGNKIPEKTTEKIKPHDRPPHPGLVDPLVTLRALLELARVAEEEFTEDELTAKEGVEEPFDHNSIWDEWEG